MRGRGPSAFASMAVLMYCVQRMIWLAAALAVCAGVGIARGDEGSPGTTPTAEVSLAVEPADVLLWGGSRRQQISITASDAEGRQVDVTRRAELAITGPASAKLEGTVLVGVSDGAT